MLLADNTSSVRPHSKLVSARIPEVKPAPTGEIKRFSYDVATGRPARRPDRLAPNGEWRVATRPLLA